MTKQRAELEREALELLMKLPPEVRKKLLAKYAGEATERDEPGRV